MKKPTKIDHSSLSPLQSRLLDALPVGRPISSSDLIELVYGEDKPFNARGLLLSAMAVLSSKLEHVGEGWRIVKGKRNGPHPISFTLEQR